MRPIPTGPSQDETLDNTKQAEFVGWLLGERGVRQSTAGLYVERANHALRELGTDQPTAAQAQALLNRWAAQGKGPAIRGNTAFALEAWSQFIGTPIKLKKPKGNRPAPRYLTAAEVEKLMGTARNNRDRAMMHLLLGSGLRAGELKRLRVEDLDLDRRAMMVDGKGGKKLWAPMTPAGAEAVRAYLTERGNPSRGPVFVTRDGRPFEGDRPLKLVKARAKRAGIVGNVGPHRCRHTFAASFLQNGGSLAHLSKLLRHGSLRATEHYSQLAESEVRAAFDRYSAPWTAR